MSLTLTDKAVNEVKRIMTDQSMEDVVLRVGITAGGCSGFSYDFGFEKVGEEPIDETKYSTIDRDGLTVIVDKKSELYLDGTTIDFYEGIERRGFTFENPNAVKSCGCGSSFQA